VNSRANPGRDPSIVNLKRAGRLTTPVRSPELYMNGTEIKP